MFKLHNYMALGLCIGKNNLFYNLELYPSRPSYLVGFSSFTLIMSKLFKHLFFLFFSFFPFLFKNFYLPTSKMYARHGSNRTVPAKCSAACISCITQGIGVLKSIVLNASDNFS